MEKIFLFNVESDTEAVIARCAGNMRIKVGIITPAMYMEPLEKIAGGKVAKPESPAAKGRKPSEESGAESSVFLPDESLMLMCGVTDKHMDRILAQLRQSSKHIDYKAVLTAANGKWTLKKLLLELEREKIAFNR